MRGLIGTILLRLGVAFALLYPAVMSFVKPEKWAALLPKVLTAFISPENFLMILAGYNILFAILILVKPDPGWMVAGVVFVTFTATAILGYRDLDFMYLNITAGLAALALAFLGKIRG
jgi:hypothetical protein